MTSSILTEHPIISVLFENEDLLAVDKPAMLASVPERNPEKISLLKLRATARKQKLFVVHRLDKKVSGVILFAKKAETHRYLNRLFEHRQIQKTYLALVHGVIEGGSAIIAKPLRCFGSGRMGEDPKNGKPCITEFSVEKRLPAYTLVKVFPRTGRKHQIRAHFFSIGHPIVGDTLYGDKSLQEKYPRLMLHALAIRFHSPAQTEIFIQSPPPSVFP